ncbi:hypothetical protein [Paraprevotella xylaniphila]|uniref:hypothetical protein n=1 Tax=Paraprevotella xylaniphila TaxID=454155 RepID=UPI0023F35D9C|nr:hypothetical protein [Paraprevotella xylaniphila]
MKKNKIFSMALALAFGAGAAITSCVDTDSSLVDFGPQLNSPNDTVYSLLGIMNKMQVVADRTIILGEMMGELSSVTETATTDLKELASFTATAGNRYNAPEDYYAVIQNCNYYIAHADTALSLRAEKVFIREYAAVKAFRAWTYLQLAIYYGRVPFFTEPLMTEAEADPSRYPFYDVKQICEYFIPDLAPYVETDYPLTGNHSNIFIPVRALLGDLCLWAGRYREAAQYYHDYLTNFDNPLAPGGNLECRWGNYEFKSHTSSFSSIVDLVDIQMEASEYDGVVSRLGDILNSTENNRYYFEMTSSQALLELSQAQRYVMVYTDPTTNLRDTISPGENTVYSDSRELGDLRLCSNVRVSHMSSRDDYSEDYQTLVRFSSFTESSFLLYVPLYRLSSVYLRMAEAYNRAGLPESAFAILKYGLSNGTVSKYINAGERERAGNLLTWSQYNFITQDMSSTSTTAVNTEGIHSYGCGESYADTLYVIPEGLATREDSILFVEDLICDEMALEQSFLGQRFGDLQRMALRRGDTDFLARKVAGRDGKDSFNAELYSRLSDRNNWYLPLE